MSAIAEFPEWGQDETSLRRLFEEAQQVAAKITSGREPERSAAYHRAALLALRSGEAAAALGLIRDALAGDPPEDILRKLKVLQVVTDWDEASLVACARTEPYYRPALEALADRYWTPMFRLAKFVVQDRESARDLAQAAWVKLLTVRTRCRPGENFEALTRRVTLNTCRDWFRREKIRKAESLDEPVPNTEGEGVPRVDLMEDREALSPEAEFLIRENEQLMAEAVDRGTAALGARYRLAVASATADEPLNDFAKSLGISYSAAATLRSRALVRLRREIEQILGTDNGPGSETYGKS